MQQQQQFTQDEIAKLEQYNKMAMAYHAFKGYEEQIRDVKAAMNDKRQPRSSEYRGDLQKQLDEILVAQRKFTEHCFDPEKGVFKPPPGREDMLLKSPHQLDARMQSIEHQFYSRVEQAAPQLPDHVRPEHGWRHTAAPAEPEPPRRPTVEEFLQRREQPPVLPQHRPPPEETIKQAYTTMQAEQARRAQIQSQAQSPQTLTDRQLEKVMQYYDRLQKDSAALLNPEKVQFYKDEIQQYVQAQLNDAKFALQDLNQRHAEQLARMGPINYSYQPPHTREALIDAARNVSREALDEKARAWQPYKQLSEREMLHMTLNDELKRGLLSDEEYLKEQTTLKQQDRQREREQQQHSQQRGKTMEH